MELHDRLYEIESSVLAGDSKSEMADDEMEKIRGRDDVEDEAAAAIMKKDPTAKFIELCHHTEEEQKVCA